MMYRLTQTNENQFQLMSYDTLVNVENEVETHVYSDVPVTEIELFNHFAYYRMDIEELWDALSEFETIGFNVAEFTERGNLLWCDKAE